MKRTLSRADLAQALGVSPRTIERWVSNGCPSTRGEKGRLYFDLGEVREWIASHGAATTTPDNDDGRDSASSAEKADLAGKIARARKAELEVAQEKNLKGLGLGQRIRDATTYATLSNLTADVAAACAEGDLRPERANALHRLIVERRRQLTKLEHERAEDPLGKKVLLCTAESETLVRAFEGLYSEARRARLLALAVQLLADDLAESPPTDTTAGSSSGSSAEPPRSAP